MNILSLRAMRVKLRVILFLFIISFGVKYSYALSDGILGGYGDIIVPKDSIWPKFSNDYFEDYSNQLGLFLQSKYNTSRIIINDRFTGKGLNYSPKNQFYIGPGFTYKIIGNGLTFSFGFLNKDEGGEPTTRIDLYVNIMLKRFVYDFSYRYYKNFTLKNTSDYSLGSTTGDELYVRPDIRTLYMGMGVVYVVNHEKFSYRATFTSTAVQKKSAGSFMFGTQVFVQELHGDSSIFPAAAELPPVTGNSSLYIGLTSSYAYNFVFKKHFYAALSLSTSFEVGKAITELNHEDYYSNYLPIFHFRPRSVIGYNSQKWYFGASSIGNYFLQLYRTGENRFEFNIRSANVRVFIGRRFNWLSRKQLRK